MRTSVVVEARARIAREPVVLVCEVGRPNEEVEGISRRRGGSSMSTSGRCLNEGEGGGEGASVPAEQRIEVELPMSQNDKKQEDQEGKGTSVKKGVVDGERLIEAGCLVG